MLSRAEVHSILRERRRLMAAMGLVIVAVTVGFGVVVYPWDLLRLRVVSPAVFIVELLPLAGLMILTVLFLADATKALERQSSEERRLLAPSAPDPQAARMAEMGPVAAGAAREAEAALAQIIDLARGLSERMPADSSAWEEVRFRAERARRRLAELLEYACADDEPPAEFRMETLVDRALQLVGPELDRRNVRVQRDFAPDLPPLRGRAVLLRQALVSLFLNAARAMEAGGRLTLKLEPLSDRAVRLEVADTGCGIAPEVLPRVGEPFFSAWADRPGLGLGLAVCREIARAHGGNVRVVSRVGSGTSVFMDLPRMQEKR